MLYVALALRLALAGVFVVSGLAKLRAFADTVAMWQSVLGLIRITGSALTRPAAVLLIVVELLAGVMLLLGGSVTIPAFGLAIAMLLAFTILAVVSARSAVDVRCACFGRATAKLGWRHVWRNLTLLALGGGGIAIAGYVQPGHWQLGGIAVAAATAVIVTMIAVFYDDIVDLISDLNT